MDGVGTEIESFVDLFVLIFRNAGVEDRDRFSGEVVHGGQDQLVVSHHSAQGIPGQIHAVFPQICEIILAGNPCVDHHRDRPLIMVSEQANRYLCRPGGRQP